MQVDLFSFLAHPPQIIFHVYLCVCMCMSGPDASYYVQFSWSCSAVSTASSNDCMLVKNLYARSHNLWYSAVSHSFSLSYKSLNCHSVIDIIDLRFPSPSYNSLSHVSTIFIVLLDLLVLACLMAVKNNFSSSWKGKLLINAVYIVSVAVSESPICYQLNNPHSLGLPVSGLPILSLGCCLCLW